MTKKRTTKKGATKSAKKTVKKAVKKKVAKKATVKKASKTTKQKTAAGKKANMTPRDKIIQKIKQDLITQKESLLKEAEETLNVLPTELNFPDMGDQATAETDRNFMLRLRDRERMLLKKIEDTIEIIDEGSYGVCEECGAEIGIKRLEARPVTTYCIDCKTRQEEEERISEGG